MKLIIAVIYKKRNKAEKDTKQKIKNIEAKFPALSADHNTDMSVSCLIAPF